MFKLNSPPKTALPPLYTRWGCGTKMPWWARVLTRKYTTIIVKSSFRCSVLLTTLTESSQMSFCGWHHNQKQVNNGTLSLLYGNSSLFWLLQTFGLNIIFLLDMRQVDTHHPKLEVSSSIIDGSLGLQRQCWFQVSASWGVICSNFVACEMFGRTFCKDWVIFGSGIGFTGPVEKRNDGKIRSWHQKRTGKSRINTEMTLWSSEQFLIHDFWVAGR